MTYLSWCLKYVFLLFSFKKTFLQTIYNKLILNEVVLRMCIYVVVLWPQITDLCLLGQTAVQILVNSTVSTRLQKWTVLSFGMPCYILQCITSSAPFICPLHCRLFSIALWVYLWVANSPQKQPWEKYHTTAKYHLHFGMGQQHHINNSPLRSCRPRNSAGKKSYKRWLNCIKTDYAKGKHSCSPQGT